MPIPVPGNLTAETLSVGGVVLDLLNDTPRQIRIIYACLSAPVVVRAVVSLDGNVVDVVHAAVPHSWWASAGNPLIPSGQLNPGQRITVITDGVSAFRIDWE